MPAFQRLTEADLRAAMRDRRYWQAGHPERATYGAWVGEGWRALNPDGGPARAAVWVRPYRREGHPVAGHWRAAPPAAVASCRRVPARPAIERARRCRPASARCRSKVGLAADTGAAVVARRRNPGARRWGSHRLPRRRRRRGRATSPFRAGRCKANTSTAQTSACHRTGVRPTERGSSRRCEPTWRIRAPFGSSGPTAGSLRFTISIPIQA